MTLRLPFLIATIPRCKGGRYSIRWIATLYPWSLPCNADCKARRDRVTFFESLVWLDLELNTWPRGPLANTLLIWPMTCLYKDKRVKTLNSRIKTVHKTKREFYLQALYSCTERKATYPNMDIFGGVHSFSLSLSLSLCFHLCLSLPVSLFLPHPLCLVSVSKTFYKFFNLKLCYSKLLLLKYKKKLDPN